MNKILFLSMIFVFSPSAATAKGGGGHYTPPAIPLKEEDAKCRDKGVAAAQALQMVNDNVESPLDARLAKLDRGFIYAVTHDANNFSHQVIREQWDVVLGPKAANPYKVTVTRDGDGECVAEEVYNLRK